MTSLACHRRRLYSYPRLILLTFVFCVSICPLVFFGLVGVSRRSLQWTGSSVRTSGSVARSREADQAYRVNVTLCPGCLRPRVVELEKHLVEFGAKDHLLEDTNFFTPSPTVLEHLVTDYLISPRLECPYLLALQASVLDKSHERDLVRKTWASVALNQTWPNRTINAKVKVLFVVAKHNISGNHSNDLHLETISSEGEHYNDILFLDMIDSYRNLTLKLLSAFKWVKDNCPCVKFVLKVDYDTFVNVPLLVDTLLYYENRFQGAILGKVYSNTASVKRYGKWLVPVALYPKNRYPHYVSGCAYVLSMKATSEFVKVAPYFRMLPIEDAYITGVLRRVVRCRMYSFGSFFTHYTDRKWNYCEMFTDRKIVGLTDSHQLIWDSFVKNVCP